MSDRRKRRVEHEDGLEHEPQFHTRFDRVSPDPGDDEEPQHRLDEEPVRAGAVAPGNPEQPLCIGDPNDPGLDPPVDEPALGWAGVTTPGFADELRERLRTTPFSLKLVVTIGAVLAAGPLAVVGAIVQSIRPEGLTAGAVSIAVITPVVEEMMKVALLLWLLERRPWLLPGSVPIVLIAVAGGVLFAGLENLLYLHVYIDDPPVALIRWRWIVCTSMHGLCTLISGLGIAWAWRQTIRTGRRAEISSLFRWLVAAMLVHGVYNGSMIIWETVNPMVE